jgi:hypothetical protein
MVEIPLVWYCCRFGWEFLDSLALFVMVMISSTSQHPSGIQAVAPVLESVLKRIHTLHSASLWKRRYRRGCSRRISRFEKGRIAGNNTTPELQLLEASISTGIKCILCQCAISVRVCGGGRVFVSDIFNWILNCDLMAFRMKMVNLTSDRDHLSQCKIRELCQLHGPFQVLHLELNQHISKWYSSCEIHKTIFGCSELGRICALNTK